MRYCCDCSHRDEEPEDYHHLKDWPCFSCVHRLEDNFEGDDD